VSSVGAFVVAVRNLRVLYPEQLAQLEFTYPCEWFLFWCFTSSALCFTFHSLLFRPFLRIAS